MSTSFIEDALKSNRNLHRLIITVSLVSVVFALSLSIPSNLVSIKNRLEELRGINFLKYEEFVDEKVQAFMKKNARSNYEKLQKLFNDNKWLVFQTNHLSDKFLSPIHIGQIMVKDTVFANLNDATLTQLDSVSSVLKVNSNVQILMPNIDSVLPDIKKFFDENGSTGTRVSNIRVGVDYGQTSLETFLPDGEHLAYLNFELIKDGPFAAAPVFNASIPSKTVEIPDTSFSVWLDSLGADHLYKKDDKGQFLWLFDLPKPPEGYRQEKLGLLSKQIESKIEYSSPSKQSVSILGTNVPGVLVIYATPLILTVLLYYFVQHISHLSRLVVDNVDSFREFSWLPLVLKKYWWLEMLFSIVLLPGVSIFLLNYKLFAFGQDLLFEHMLSALCVCVTFVFSYFIFKNLAVIRLHMS